MTCEARANALPRSSSFEVRLPARKRTDRISNAILARDPKAEVSVEWEDKDKGK